MSTGAAKSGATVASAGVARSPALPSPEVSAFQSKQPEDSKAKTAPTTMTSSEAQASGGAEEPAGSSARSFGEGIVSEKPLDEVILNYLVENARKRKRRRS